MSCHDIREYLGAYLLGEVDEAESQRVEDHVRACADCRVEMEQLSSTIRDIYEVVGKENAVSSVSSEDSSVSSEDSASSTGVVVTRPRWRLRAAAALVLVAVAFGLAYSYFGTRSDEGGSRGGLTDLESGAVNTPTDEANNAQYDDGERGLAKGIRQELEELGYTGVVDGAVDRSELSGADARAAGLPRRSSRSSPVAQASLSRSSMTLLDFDVEVAQAAFIADPKVDVVLTNGGTGVTGRDTTPEAVRAVLDKEIPGFGELFRWLSFQKIGTSTIQSRALGGVGDGTYIFALPGSTGACKDAWDGILATQLDSRFRPCNFVELMPRLKEQS